MPEQKFWSVTSLAKAALGNSEGIVYHNKEVVVGICFDDYKHFKVYVEDADRDGAIEWALGKYWSAQGKTLARGSEVHKAAEQLALGTIPEVSNEIAPFVAQYQRFLEDYEPQFLMAEAPVYNTTVGYAGTLDAVAVIQGKTVVVDTKTTAHGPNAKTRSGKPKSRPPFPEVALQLTMYRRAELVGLLAERVELQRGRYYVLREETHTEPMPETEGGVCVVISPEDYMVVPVDTSLRVWKACRHMIEVARFQVETSKSVFGPPVSPNGSLGQEFGVPSSVEEVVA